MTDGQSEVQDQIDEANRRRRFPDKFAEMLEPGEAFVLGVRRYSPGWRWVLSHARTNLRIAEGVQVPSEATAARQTEQLIAAGIFSDRVTLEQPTPTHNPRKS